MSHRRAFPALAALFAALCFLSTPALAQGVVDQSNDPANPGAYSCGSPQIGNGTLVQTFVPAADNLIAVELRLQAGPSFPSTGLTTTVNLRAADGTLLQSVNASIAGPLASQTQQMVRFDFQPVSLTPGATYQIEWVTDPGGGLVIGWNGVTTDPYAAGTGYSCTGSAWFSGMMDYNFVTYAAAAETSESTCKEKIEALLARVEELESAGKLRRRKAHVLKATLRGACHFLDRGRPRLAWFKLRLFRFQVRLSMCFRWISWSDGADLRRDARDAMRCLHAEICPRS